MYEAAIVITILLIICMYCRAYKGFCIVLVGGALFYLLVDKSCL